MKNSKFKACFIVDLDPDFNLLESEMYKTTSENVIILYSADCWKKVFIRILLLHINFASVMD